MVFSHGIFMFFSDCMLAFFSYCVVILFSNIMVVFSDSTAVKGHVHIRTFPLFRSIIEAEQ